MLRAHPPITQDGARQLNPLQLAHIGDTVWDLLVRETLLHEGKNLRHMHSGAVQRVNAAAQAKALERIRAELTEAEEAIVLRGRNAHAHHVSPHHQTQADYAASTALEALVGYLYLTGQEERLLRLFALAQEDTCPEQN